MLPLPVKIPVAAAAARPTRAWRWVSGGFGDVCVYVCVCVWLVKEVGRWKGGQTAVEDATNMERNM